MNEYDGNIGDLNSEESMEERVDQLASRHIAKCLDHLGDTIAPVQIASIKRSFRFFAEDIKQVIQGDDNELSSNDMGRFR